MEQKNYYNFSILQVMLREGWADIQFTKKDGTTKKIRATTHLLLVPPELHPKPKDPDAPVKEQKVESDRLYNVYVDGTGWRSFRESQVTHVFGEEILNEQRILKEKEATEFIEANG